MLTLLKREHPAARYSWWGDAQRGHDGHSEAILRAMNGEERFLQPLGRYGEIKALGPSTSARECPQEVTTGR